MNLHEVMSDPQGRGKKKRVGRGRASGMGKTCGRGHNGPSSRSGYSQKLGYEGGQTPLIRRLPKVGFNNPFRKEYATINVARLESIEEGVEVTPALLKEIGMVGNLRDGLKILGDGEISKKLVVCAHKFTKSAVEKIEKSGGEVKVIG